MGGPGLTPKTPTEGTHARVWKCSGNTLVQQSAWPGLPDPAACPGFFFVFEARTSLIVGASAIRHKMSLRPHGTTGKGASPMRRAIVKNRSSAFQGGFRDKHNDLFRAGPNWKLNACVGWNGSPADFQKYASGYFDAAARLVKSLQEDSWMVDRVIYPLAMLYRHGIELALKHLARMLPALFKEEGAIKLTHKLQDNWRVVRSYLERLKDVPDGLDEAEATLNDFVEIDPNGEVFRYPHAKDGTRYLEETSHINVDVLAEHLDLLGAALDGYCDWVNQLCEWQMEMEAEYGAEHYGE
jgi:hypothetical protein